MTPIEIIDQMIEELPEDFSWQIDMVKDIALREARERIMNECTVRLSDGDNTYDIPYALEEEFFMETHTELPEEWTDEFEDWCADFDSKYSKYKV